jgi:hypothetical protein
VPVLFLNGEWDEYTAAEDARLFGNHVATATFTTLKPPATSSTWSTKPPAGTAATHCLGS